MVTVPLTDMQPAYLDIDKITNIVLKKDAAHYLVDDASKESIKDFCDVNRFQYEIAMTSWLVILHRNNPDVARATRDLLATHGLVSVIGSADGAANNLVHEESIPYPWYALQGDMRTKLQALRFLKRFTPARGESLAHEAINGFVEIQNSLNKLWDNAKLLTFAKSYQLAEIKDALNRLLLPFSDVPDFVRFTSGAHIGVGSSLQAKCDQLLQSDPDAISRGDDRSVSFLTYDGHVRPHELAPSPKSRKGFAVTIAHFDHIWFDRYYNSRSQKLVHLLDGSVASVDLGLQNQPLSGRDINMMQCVPKSYKTSRLIAPETTLRQWNATRLARATEDNFSPLAKQIIPLHDQQLNVDAARIGSEFGGNNYILSPATIDQSSASDSLSEHVFRLAFPLWYQRLYDALGVRANRTVLPYAYRRFPKPVDPCSPTTWKLEEPATRDYTILPLATHLTSGNSCTFIHESLFFAAVAIVATERMRLCHADPRVQDLPELGTADWEHYLATNISVYGDDVCLPSYAATYFMDVLAWMGFKPNMSKSFWSPETTYRESCGYEFYDGKEVQSQYWPRRAIQKGKEWLPSLIAMQHRFSNDPILRDYFSKVCRTIEPKLTAHMIGTECDDLWETIPKAKFCKAPFARSSHRRLNPSFLAEWDDAIKKCNLYCSISAAGQVKSPMFLETEEHSRPYASVLDIREQHDMEPLLWEYFIREKHHATEPTYPKVDEKALIGATGQYCMRIFLEEGPWFEDKLLELLNVSSPRYDSSQLMLVHSHTKPSYKLVTRLE